MLALGAIYRFLDGMFNHMFNHMSNHMSNTHTSNPSKIYLVGATSISPMKRFVGATSMSPAKTDTGDLMTDYSRLYRHKNFKHGGNKARQ